MKLIERTPYLDKLKRVCGTPDIKVVTGVRRSGKSRLMDSYIGWIEESKKDSNIIYIDFTNLKYEGLKEYHALNDYVEEHYRRGMNNYLFIDEVQMCPSFELTINSLHSSGKYDIYVTGSNAFLLSSDFHLQSIWNTIRKRILTRHLTNISKTVVWQALMHIKGKRKSTITLKYGLWQDD